MIHKFFRRQSLKSRENAISRRDIGVLGIFVGAISVLILVACYVVSRVSSERAYREKWKDYNDCGWA